jgi:hypothetical protein
MGSMRHWSRKNGASITSIMVAVGEMSITTAEGDLI